MNPETGFTYGFSLTEAKKLALFLRLRQKELPPDIVPFFTEIQDFVYNSMTIDEAERLFL